MATNEKKILITGFEPFGGDGHNLSGEWVTAQLNKDFGDRIVKAAVLPVVFHECFVEFKKVFDVFDPDLVLMTGIAANRELLSVERIGINWQDARIPDNKGLQPRSQKIIEGAPDGLFTTIDLIEMQKICPDLKISTSAGEYVCNDLLYEVLYYINSINHRARATFLHLPGKLPPDVVMAQLDTILAKL